MKSCVLQVSWNGGPPERFEALCDDGVDHLVGVELVRSRQGSEDRVILFDKKETGHLAACVVCEAGGYSLPTFILPLNDMKRLVLMPKAEVTLLELLTDEKYERDAEFSFSKMLQFSPETNEVTPSLNKNKKNARLVSEEMVSDDESPFEVVSHEKSLETSEDRENAAALSEVSTRDSQPLSRSNASTKLNEFADKEEAWEEVEAEKASNEAGKDSWSDEEEGSSRAESSTLRSPRFNLSANDEHYMDSTTKIVDETLKPSIAAGAAGIAVDPFGSTCTSSEERKSNSRASTAPVILADENEIEIVTPQNVSKLNQDQKRTEEAIGSANGQVTLTQDHPLAKENLAPNVGAVGETDARGLVRTAASGVHRVNKMSRSLRSSPRDDLEEYADDSATSVSSRSSGNSDNIQAGTTGDHMTSTSRKQKNAYVPAYIKRKATPQSDMTAETKGSMVSTLLRKVGLTQEPMRIILTPLKGWTEYAHAVHNVDHAVTAEGASAVKRIADEVNSLLRKEDCALPHLSLAAYVCNIEPGAYTEALQLSILQCLSQETPWDRVGISEVKIFFKKMDMRPNLVWHNFFARLFKDKSDSLFEAEDSLFVNIFWIWNDSGLFRRPYNSNLWQGIRGMVAADFFCRQSQRLMELMQAPVKVKSLGVLLQPTFVELIESVLELTVTKTGGTPLLLHSYTAQFLIELVAKHDFGLTTATYSLFSSFFTMLTQVDFGIKKSVQNDIIQCTVQAISFHALRTFRLYKEVAAAVGPDYKYAATLRQIIEETLCSDLDMEPDINEVTGLVSSPIGYYLSSDQGMSAIKRYSFMAMQRETPFHGKLNYLGNLHNRFVSRQWAADTSGFERHILDSILVARKRGDSAVILEQSFRVAKDCSSIFCCEEKVEAFLTRVSDFLCSDKECSAVLDNPALLQRLPFEESQSSEKTLHAYLIRRLRDLLTRNCLDESQTCRVVLATLAQEASSRSHLASLGVDVFKTCFLRWNLQHMSDLIAFPSVSLQLLDDYFNQTTKATWIDPEDRDQIKKCHDHVKSAVTSWLSRYRMEALTKNTLEEVFSGVNESHWHLIKKISGIDLPSFSQMHAKHREFYILEESIAQLLRGSEDELVVSIQRIFKGYNCDSDPRSALHRLLTEYDYFSRSDELTNQTNQTESSSVLKELRHLREDSDSGSSFSNENSEYLSMCDYFLKNPSVLFQNALFEHDGERPTLHDLVLAAKRAKRTLVNCLGSCTSSYRDTDHAVKIVLAAGITVEHETSVLLGCSLLGLSPDDIRSFLVMAVLSEASRPLERFVESCLQFSFAAALNDQSFSELASIVQDIIPDSMACLSVNECLDYSRRLCDILGVERHLLSDDIVGIRKAIQKCIPILRLVGDFSCHSEVWPFAREMGWFGQEGLKQFYEQYANVTNVLLGDTASYEMSVLGAVEPTIRLVSAIGGLCQEAELVDLFNRIQADKDVDSFLHSASGSADIGQVQANLSQIRDWFTVGVDEIAAVHGTFDDVCKTGKYIFHSLEARETDGLTPGMDNDSMESVLALQYKTKRASPAQCCLQGEALAGFVQKIGLIQHENECIAASVNSFIEQYQVLMRAANNVIFMRSIGYGKAGHDSFSCSVGSDSLTRARDLLLESESSLAKCKSWLDILRSTHFVSLLFLTEELLEIHSAIRGTVAAPVPTSKRSLTCILSRLACGTMSYQDLFSITTKATESWEESSGQTFSSWLVDVCMFMDSLHESFGAPWKKALDYRRERSRVVLHTIVGQSSEFLPLSLRVLKHIYKDCLPKDFEILDGLVACSSDTLSLFLERVMTFRTNTFAILNVEALEGKLLERILSFLSDPGIALKGIHLHIIQREGSMFHTAPWIHGERWESDSSHESDTPWKTLILDCVHVKGVSIVWSPRSGAGKTRYIEEKLRKPSESVQNVEVAKVTINERTSITSLTEDLAKKFSDGSGPKAIHFILTHLPNDTDEGTTNSSVEALNHFFLSLLALRFVRSSSSAQSFHLGESCWDIYVELPNNDDYSTRDSVTDWLHQNLPILPLCGTLRTPTARFAIDDASRRVSLYLRAYNDGTINRKFESMQHRRILLILDKSGSMAAPMGDSNALFVATDNALRIFDNHVGVGDSFGVIMFDHTIDEQIPVQTVVDESHRHQMRKDLDLVRNLADTGGTSMYSALQHAFSSVSCADDSLETWIVCLTDGASGDDPDIVRPYLQESPENVHLIIIGVNLDTSLESQMRDLCNKYGTRTEPCKGFFIRSETDMASINSAFDTVSQNIPVSKTFELDGAITNDECRHFLDTYVPDFVDRNDMLLMTFWVQFIYRRVRMFDKNESFNYNETHDALGSTLMRTMLEEVERLMSNNQSRDWIGKDHTQLIYDFTRNDAPEFRLVCTAPDEMDPSTRRRLEKLDLPGFSIPTNRELQLRSTLDCFLSQALNLPLEGGRLKCVDDNNFVLTLDFTMKLLSIHERVACCTPCVIEGETGVSKTALTRMYSILRNVGVEKQVKLLNQQHLDDIVRGMIEKGHDIPAAPLSQERLERALVKASEAVIGNETDLARDLHQLILKKCADRSGVCQDVPTVYSSAPEGRTVIVTEFLRWFSDPALEPLFFDINMDSSLTEGDIVESFHPVRRVARKCSDAVVVVFLDEFNTSSVMGLCKEIVIDRTLAGQSFEDNIVVIAACNPARKQLHTGANLRERDLGREWAGGHYQVAELPHSIAKIKWSFGSLNHDQEKDFIFRRLEIAGGETVPRYLQISLTEFISESQEAMRTFAARNIRDSLVLGHGEIGEDIDHLTSTRARSVVSLRDIQRVFSLFDFFSSSLQIPCIVGAPRDQRHRRSMLLAIATVYYLRLDSLSRTEFLEMTRALPAEQGDKYDLQWILNQAMDEVIDDTDIPEGIAVTRGVKENVFMTLVCTLSGTPLIIVGPPGSSKTLSVNIVADNANGEDTRSSSSCYRKHARLSLFHYQCSKQSTSKELLAVFEKATQRQKRIDSAKHRCFILMDEAGLPEEKKESLKVLHYLLEGHMSAKRQIGFVGISNHVLDAAKTNRCVMLLREEPDEEEMLSISCGVLFRGNGHFHVRHVDLGGELVDAKSFALSLCQSYASLLHDDKELSWFSTFFGLRDFIHFLKAIRSQCMFERMIMTIDVKAVIFAVERNFNGVGSEYLHIIAESFLKPLVERRMNWSRDLLDGAFRDPVRVIQDALLASNEASSLFSRTRFKLIIDCTDDDSILRLLSSCGIVDVSKRSMFKLSHMQQEGTVEELKLISGVKFAALQGNLAVLSQTESINESFYDLFNQRFQAVTSRDGEVSLYANIAVGGISRRSLVKPEFECVIHVKQSNLLQMPAPFLNRFEKFRLTISDVLHFGWNTLGGVSTLFAKSRRSAAKLVSVLGESGLSCWMNDSQTLDSVFIDMLPVTLLDTSGAMKMHVEDMSSSACEADRSIADLIIEFVRCVSSLRPQAGDVHLVIEAASKYLNVDDAEVLSSIQEETSGLKSVRDSLQSILTLNDDVNQVSRVCRILVQMLVTRMAVRRVMQMATPESVFAARDCLPNAVLNDYFEQNHFSLKRLIGKLTEAAQQTNRTNMTVVYTRSDACIHGIPTHCANGSLALRDVSAIKCLHDLAHENVDELIVEHLSLLKSEALLSSAIESWTKNSRKRIFLLLVDMSSPSACERTNYVRMCVEQQGRETQGKSFVLLLHYAPSSTHHQSCYPSLFLGGWEHHFLDGVGSQRQSLGMEQLIEAACRCDSADDPRTTLSICSLVEALLPRVIPHVASQQLFYPRQKKRDRTSLLQSVMNSTVGGTHIASILCMKFARMWASHALLFYMRRAAEGLIRCTTQLSLTMSMESVLVETFDTFLSAELMEMNQWRNLDVLLDTDPGESIRELYGRILIDLPTIPFEELILQRTRSRAVQVSPLTDPRNESADVHFPFFRLISSFIDECIEKVEQLLGQERAVGADSSMISQVGEELLLRTMDSLSEPISCDQGSPYIQNVPGRARSVLTAITFVQENESNDASLFNKYLYHFIEWRVGCEAHPFIVDWMLKEIAHFDSSKNIVSIHIAAKLKSSELLKMASILDVASSASFLVASRIDDKSHGVPSAKTGEELFEELLEHFERTVFTDDVLSYEWNASFSVYLQQIHAMLSGVSVQDHFTACRLRVLCFFSILIEASASTRVQQKAIWRERGSMSVNDWIMALSLKDFIRAVRDTNDGSGALAEELALRHFFSTLWMRTTHVFKDDDFAFLITYIADGGLDGQDRQLAIVLLHRACFHDEHTVIAPSPILSEICISDSLLGLTARLSCDQVAVFSSEGKRTCIPHYVPDWLQRDGVDPSPAEVVDSYFDSFLRSYVHCFECKLSRVTFEMLLQIHLCEAEEVSSEKLFLGLLKSIQTETSLDRLEQTRFSRSRKAGDHSSWAGSPLGAIILDVRLTCFVAKVAQEIAVDSKVTALSGLYAEATASLFEELMSIQHLKWQEFFMWTILRISGEGTLASALRDVRELNSMAWCQPWILGMPSHASEVAGSLKKAEDALAEAANEEERKSREMRLCPHCQQPFMVHAMNCGSFVCGRDYHHNRQVQGVHGCGRTFHLDTAPYYVADELLLAPLRANVVEEQAKFREHVQAMSLWDNARNFVVPPLSFKIEHDISKRSLLPISSFLSEEANSDSQKSVAHLVKVLLDGSKRSAQYSLLPDLIEFYMWLHATFRFLLTREQAFQMKMCDVMKPERLRRRFDRVTVAHLTALWERVASGVSQFLREVEYKIAWQCQEIHIAFTRFEEAPLVALLSEGEHPTDGNDVLFLLVNDIVGAYNSYVGHLVEFVDWDKTDSVQKQEVHPKFIATGCGGAVSMSTVVPLPRSELSRLVASCWASESEVYDLEKLETALRREVSLHTSPPIISDPSHCLRERFRFRDDMPQSRVDAGARVSVFVGQQGEFFANHQDFQLADDVRKSLLSLEMVMTDDEVRRTLSDNFHNYEYDQLRLMLEGCRSLLATLSTELLVFESVDQALQAAAGATGRSSTDNTLDALRSFGFPYLEPAQEQLLADLNAAQFVELVNYLSYQLASESHLFANLPLCMTDQLKDIDREEINGKLVQLCEDHGVAKVIGFLEEFTHLVLRFYETQIRSAASSNSSMKIFLSENNCCDDSSDPVFALLPNRVTLRNYISLQQHLHQRKLALLSSEPSAEVTPNVFNHNIDSKTLELFTRPSRGKCWLWEADDEMDHQETCEDEQGTVLAPFNDKWSLWFEPLASDEQEDEFVTVIDESKKPATCFDSRSVQQSGGAEDEAGVAETDIMSMEVDGIYCAMNEDEVGATNNEKSTLILQKWWRRQRSQLDRNDKDDDGLPTRNELISSVDIDSATAAQDENIIVQQNAAGPPEAFDGATSFPQFYDTTETEQEMFLWLKENQLCKAVVDKMIELGAHSIEDAVILVETPEFLEEFKVLDRMKLKKAIVAYRPESRG